MFGFFNFINNKRIILSLYLSLCISTYHIIFIPIYIAAVQDNIYKYPGYADYSQAPLIDPYYIWFSVDDKSEDALLSKIEDKNIMPFYFNFKEIAVVDNIILGYGFYDDQITSGKRYIIFRPGLGEIKTFENYEQFKNGWTEVSNNELPALVTPYKYYLDYWNNNPNRLGLVLYRSIGFLWLAIAFFLIYKYHLNKKTVNTPSNHCRE